MGVVRNVIGQRIVFVDFFLRLTLCVDFFLYLTLCVDFFLHLTLCVGFFLISTASTSLLASPSPSIQIMLLAPENPLADAEKIYWPTYNNVSVYISISYY